MRIYTMQNKVVICNIVFQTNLHMSREIASLKAQLQEMRNMMKVSFDLQMDIQRAIRQEVAAGIAAANGE